LTPLTPCRGGMPNAGTATPPTTRVHAATSIAALQNSSGRTNLAVGHTGRTLLYSKIPAHPHGKHPWWPPCGVMSNTVAG
jgi:hypothetical protein